MPTDRPAPTLVDVGVNMGGNIATNARPLTLAEKLPEIFKYHSPTEEQVPKYERIRAAGHLLAKTIVENTPASADQTAAIRLVREAVMIANAAIALKGLV